MLEKTKQALSDNLTALLKKHSHMSRLDLSKRMQVADGTLGRIKYGTGNPQLENLIQIANFFKLQPWQLLIPNGHMLPKNFDPFATLTPKQEGKRVRIPLHKAFPSTDSEDNSVDYAAVLNHIDVTELWAKKHLGCELDSIRALPIISDSMSPTLNEGDLAFIDTSKIRFETDGIYLILWNGRLLLKRLTINLLKNCIEVRSDNPISPIYDIPSSQIDALQICGRIKTWMAIKNH